MILLAIVIEVLSLAIVCSSQFPTVIPFCFKGDCYIIPEYIGKSWMEAQHMCRMYNSTLPIVNNPDRQRSFEAALYYFRLNATSDVWLGANATDYGSGNWSWLDGRRYSGTVVPNSVPYNKSYAFLSKNGTGIIAYASAPYGAYSYICQYDMTITDACNNGTGRLGFIMENKCYVKYSEKLSWFNARNNCLTNNGDLASFIDVYLPDGIVDSSGSWIALRRSQWKWQVAVTGKSFDVTFTLWRYDQPDDSTPSCIAIDYGDFPNWRDRDCSVVSQYICLLINTTSAVSTTTTSVYPNGRSATSSSDARVSNTNYQLVSGNDSQQNDKAVAVGVGIGVPCAIVILVLVVALIVQQRKFRRYSANIKSERKQIKDTKEISTPSPTSVSPGVENDANHQYQQLDRIDLQEQRQYEQLPQSQL